MKTSSTLYHDVVIRLEDTPAQKGQVSRSPRRALAFPAMSRSGPRLFPSLAGGRVEGLGNLRWRLSGFQGQPTRIDNASARASSLSRHTKDRQGRSLNPQAQTTRSPNRP